MFYSFLLLQSLKSRRSTYRVNSTLRGKNMQVLSAMSRVLRDREDKNERRNRNDNNFAVEGQIPKKNNMKLVTASTIEERDGVIARPRNYFLTPSLETFAREQNALIKKTAMATAATKNNSKSLKWEEEEELQEHKSIDANKKCISEDNKLFEKIAGNNNNNSCNVLHSVQAKRNKGENVDISMETKETVEAEHVMWREKESYHEQTSQEENQEFLYTAAKLYDQTLHTSIITKVSTAVNYTFALHRARNLLKLIHTHAYQDDASHLLFVRLLQQWRLQELQSQQVTSQVQRNVKPEVRYKSAEREWEAGIVTRLNLAQSSSSASRKKFTIHGFTLEPNDVQINEVCNDGKVVCLTEVELPKQFNETLSTGSSERRRRETLRCALEELSPARETNFKNVISTSEVWRADMEKRNTTANQVKELIEGKRTTTTTTTTTNSIDSNTHEQMYVYLHLVLYKEAVTLEEALNTLIDHSGGVLQNVHSFIVNTRLCNDYIFINTPHKNDHNNYYCNNNNSNITTYEQNCVTTQVCSVQVSLHRVLNLYNETHEQSSVHLLSGHENNEEDILDAFERFVQELLHVNTFMQTCVIQPLRWSSQPFVQWTRSNTQEVTNTPSTLSFTNLETHAQYSVLLRGFTNHTNHLQSIAQTAALCVPNFFSTGSFGPAWCPFRSYHVLLALSDACYAEAMVMLLCMEMWETRNDATSLELNISGDHSWKNAIDSKLTSPVLLCEWQVNLLSLLKNDNKRLGSLKAWWAEIFPVIQSSLKYKYSESVPALMWNVLLSCRLADYHIGTKSNSHINSNSTSNNSSNNKSEINTSEHTHSLESDDSQCTFTMNDVINKENFTLCPLRAGDFAQYVQHKQISNTQNELEENCEEQENRKENVSVKFVQDEDEGCLYTIYDLLLPFLNCQLTSSTSSYSFLPVVSQRYEEIPLFKKLYCALKMKSTSHSFLLPYSSVQQNYKTESSANSIFINKKDALERKRVSKFSNCNSSYCNTLRFRRAFVACTGFPRTQRPWIKEFVEPISTISIRENNTNTNATDTSSNTKSAYSLLTDLDLALRNANAAEISKMKTQDKSHVNYANSTKSILYPFSSRGRAITERLPSGMLSAAMTDSSSFSSFLLDQTSANTYYKANCSYKMHKKFSKQQSKCLALHFTLPAECSWHNYIREVCVLENYCNAATRTTISLMHEPLLNKNK